MVTRTSLRVGHSSSSELVEELGAPQGQMDLRG